MLDKNILGILSAEQQNTGQNKFRLCLAAAHTHNNWSWLRWAYKQLFFHITSLIWITAAQPMEDSL